MKMHDLMNAQQSAINQALSLAYGHARFLERNIGKTENAEIDHYVFNPEYVLSNNRHFIARAQFEAQPNGDATTEGQSITLMGFIEMFKATGDNYWWDWATKTFEAYCRYFYNEPINPIPDPPDEWLCNWIVNGKEPVLSNYPIDPEWPTHSGFKGVEFNFNDGVVYIPHGAPHWGEYLDVVTFAFRGNLGWDAINASAYDTNLDGSTNWSKRATEFKVVELINYEGKKFNSNGDRMDDVIYPDNMKGYLKVEGQLNGTYKLNYATRQPVEHGGRLMAANAPWHNRPLNVPIDVVGFYGNASDAEQWFCDCAYEMMILEKDATKKARYAKIYECSRITCNKYADIDSNDKFFRKALGATTPFTDGISYDYYYPSATKVNYTRDPNNGMIVFTTDQSAQVTLEQQSIWYRVNTNSEFTIEAGGVGNSGKPVQAKPVLKMATTKGDNIVTRDWLLPMPASTIGDPAQIPSKTVTLDKFIALKKNNGSNYLVADTRNATAYGDASYQLLYVENIIDGRNGNVLAYTMNEDGGGYGFYLEPTETAPIRSITYATDSAIDFNIRFEDDNGWRWWWMVPGTSGVYKTIPLLPEGLTLSGYQPNHGDEEPRPTTPVYSDIKEFSILQDSSGTVATLFLYCVNDIPERFNVNGSYTLYFDITLQCDETFKGIIGDCYVTKQRDDALTYTPGVIPFSNIHDPYSPQYDGWRGLPYPGYQVPAIYITDDNAARKAENMRRFTNMVNFCYDAQIAYKNHIGINGPVAAAYVWWRWDNLKYGTPNTFIFTHWADDPWSGYQPRAFQGLARGYQLCVEKGWAMPARLKPYLDNWVNFLYGFMKANNGRSPTEFTSDAPPTAPDNDFTGHMTGLWLCGCCELGLAGYQNSNLDAIISMLLKELEDNYIVMKPGFIMNGSWSPAPRENSGDGSQNNGMFFGFWAGEILKGLGTYLQYCKYKGRAV